MSIRKRFPILILTAAMAGVIALGCAAACAVDDSPSARGTPGKKTSTVKIRIEVENKTLTLDDNPTSRNFVSLLPLRLTLKNFAAAEKISELPRKLSIPSAPAGYDPDIKDVACYASRGTLAIFYKDAACADGLIKLAQIDGDLDALNTPGAVKATIELVNSETRSKK